MSYTANDIQTLSFRDAIRQRIAMYMGSADNMGVLQCVREIITNSIDEATMGYGKKITISLNGNIVTIADEGRGCPFGIRDDGTEALEAIYTMPHSGGKFNDKTYQNVAGMNGIGAKGVALSSDTFEVWSYRDGQCAYLKLKDGIKESFTVTNVKHHSGTKVSFEPSAEVYNLEPILIDFEEIKQMCRDWSYLTPEVTFDLTNEMTNEHIVYLSKNGMLDFMKDVAGTPIHKTPLHITLTEGDITAEVVMEWTNNNCELSHTFTNGLENVEGGTSLTGVKTAITNFFKKYTGSKENNDVVRKGLFYTVSCKIPNPSFANQTKTKVNNPELRGICQRATTQMLDNFVKTHKDEFDKILTMAEKALKAEAAAEKARQQVLSTDKETEKASKQKVFDVDKLSDARTLGKDAILLLVEGKSAGGQMLKVRDVDRYGILKLRGKIINAESNNIDEVLANEEVKLFLKATGINISDYKKSKLRYGKVGICVDGDSDGGHIACLIVALIYKFAPEFIKEGRLCWLHAPLFKVQGKKETRYYYSEDELKNDHFTGEQTRFKGLGEMSDIDAKCMFDKNQHLEILHWEDGVGEVVEKLMGKDSEPRKEFIFTRIDFEKYGDR